jgi:cell wall-associated NlpC family hydrolase
MSIRRKKADVPVIIDCKSIVEKYVGIPYAEHGRTLEGLSCYGLAMSIYRDYGITLDELNEEKPGINLAAIIKSYHKDWIKTVTMHFLDLIILDVFNEIHVGIYLKSGEFIQSLDAGVVLCRLYDWKDKIRGIYRHKKLT